MEKFFMRRHIWNLLHPVNKTLLIFLGLDFSTEEISLRLNITRKTVHKYLIRARKKLLITRSIHLFRINTEVIDEIQDVIRLTKRGRSVFQLFLRGFRDREIGEMLGMSYSGVRRHKEKILQTNACATMHELACMYKTRCEQRKKREEKQS